VLRLKTTNRFEKDFVNGAIDHNLAALVSY